MAFRRLVNQYQALMQNGDVQGIRNDRAMLIGSDLPTDSDEAFVDTATVLDIDQLGNATIFFRGLTAIARQVNDEPLTVSQVVVFSKTRDNEFIIHGSAH